MDSEFITLLVICQYKSGSFLNPDQTQVYYIKNIEFFILVKYCITRSLLRVSVGSFGFFINVLVCCFFA
jgi:hypothetical protein